VVYKSRPGGVWCDSPQRQRWSPPPLTFPPFPRLQIGNTYPNLSALAYDGQGNPFRCLVDLSNPQLLASFWPDVWGDVNATFPSPWVHLGGDEFWDCWNEAPAMVAWMKVRQRREGGGAHPPRCAHSRPLPPPPGCLLPRCRRATSR
jgi:hypothetical protein